MTSDDLVKHFFGGFIRLHILHHAVREPVFGVGMIEELGRHGYRLGPGTLYPILHQLHSAGYLDCEVEVRGGKRRRNYRATEKGAQLLDQARAKLRELFHEVVDPE